MCCFETKNDKYACKIYPSGLLFVLKYCQLHMCQLQMCQLQICQLQMCQLQKNTKKPNNKIGINLLVLYPLYLQYDKKEGLK